MNRVEGYISFKEIEFPSINRKITLSELSESMKRAFPVIYDSMHRGRGLALGIIEYLYERGEASMYALKRALNAELPAVRKILKRMEEKGYVVCREEEGRGPKRKKYVFSITPLGVLVYRTVFTHDPHSWLIGFVLENVKDKGGLESEIVEFLERNKRLLENKAFAELSNYLFIKCVGVNLEEQYESLERSPFEFAISVTYGLLLSIILSFTRISKFSVQGNSVQEAMELLKLYPGLGRAECLEEIPHLINDLQKQNILSELELYKLLSSYLKDVVLPATLTSFSNIVNLVIVLEPLVHPQATRKINELGKRVKSALDTLTKAVEELEKL